MKNDSLKQFELIDRSALILTPREPFLAWINSIETDEEMGEEEMLVPSIYLIPDLEDETEAEKYLRKNFDRIFTQELSAWYPDEDLWPKKRTFNMFIEWVDIKVSNLVWDEIE